jgi:hypothetical protein
MIPGQRGFMLVAGSKKGDCVLRPWAAARDASSWLHQNAPSCNVEAK